VGSRSTFGGSGPVLPKFEKVQRRYILKTAAKTKPTEPARARDARGGQTGQEASDGEKAPLTQGAGAPEKDKQAAQPWKDFHADLSWLQARLLPDGRTALEYIKSDLIGQAVERRTGRMVEKLLTMFTLFIGDGPIDTWYVPQFPESLDPKDRDLVRLLLCFVWQVSTLFNQELNQDKEVHRAILQVAKAEMLFYKAEEARKALEAHRAEGRRAAALLASLLGVERRMDVFGSDAGSGYVMDGGPKAPEGRARVVEEFANYVDHGTIQVLRTTHLLPTDTRSITMADDAYLSCLECDWRVKDAVEKTGHSFREILKECQLVLGGQPDYPDTWPIRWPPGYISPAHGHLVRVVLFLTWHPSADDYRDEDLQRRHGRTVAWMADYEAAVRLTAAHRSRQAGGKAARKKQGDFTTGEVKRRWMESKVPENSRASAIAASMAKDEHPISATRVRQIVRTLGLRKEKRK
jgi:hypothetical protein